MSDRDRPGYEPPDRDSRDPRAGSIVAGGLRLDALLAAGQVVEVWRGRTRSGETVAVKLPKRRWQAHPGAVELLRREHRVLAVLHHPHIMRAVGWFEERGRCSALATEFLGAGDLVALAGAHPRHWIEAVADVVSAVELVHAGGYVHGDLKARNVLFSLDDRAKLADFGSALEIGAPLPRGGRTAALLPVRYRPARATPADDVYALAVLLYELLSGRLPFGRESGGTAEPVDRGPGEFAEPAPPLDPGLRAQASLVALSDRVMATLRAADGGSAGTLTQFVDVIESVRAALGNEGRPAYERNR